MADPLLDQGCRAKVSMNSKEGKDRKEDEMSGVLSIGSRGSLALKAHHSYLAFA